MFQFQYGTIKSNSFTLLSVAIVCFNSNMVRLKVPSNDFSQYYSRFQFQYGTIKRKNLHDHRERQERFQFQYGTIKRQMFMMMKWIVILFQFQYGTIKRIKQARMTSEEWGFNSNMVRLKVLNDNMIARRSKVSIPIWYD